MRFIYSKNFAVFAFLLVLAFIVTFSYHRGWLVSAQRAALNAPRPISFVLKKITRPFKIFFSNAYHLKKIASENSTLKEQIWKFQAQQVLLDQSLSENQQLKKELGFAKSSKLTLLPCAVIGRNPTGVIDTLIINCGTDSGAEVGRAVLSRGYLVGKIIYTASNFSTVHLISNSGFSVDARLSQTGRLAVVRGSFNSGLVLEQVSNDEPLSQGMLAVTAGVNEKIPKNLLIGEVGEIVSNQNDFVDTRLHLGL